MNSHYPTSAELAAFRRSIHNRTSNHGLYEPCITDDPTWNYSAERVSGIGFRAVAIREQDVSSPPVSAYVNSRREAGRMRSETFAL